MKKIFGFVFSVILILSLGVSANESDAANANLFVGYPQGGLIVGHQVMEVVVIDSDINDTDEPKPEPNITINDNKLRMVQALDGNWYGYFADKNQAQIADPAVANFGTFCSPDSTVLGVSVLETAGIAVDFTDCSGSQVTNNMNVFSYTPKDMNPGNGVDTLPGQIGFNPDAWPFVQLYDLGDTEPVVISYNKGGGAQSENHTFVADGDGIQDIIDLQPSTNSADFSDVSLGGTTYGTIKNDGGNFVWITDLPNPDGVLVQSDGSGTGNVQIIACGSQPYTIAPGASQVVQTCGSLILEVILGNVTATLVATDGSTATATLDSGDDFYFDDETFTMESTKGTADITLVSDDGTTTEIPLTEGNIITVDPETSIITNTGSGDVTIVIDGEEQTVLAGESAVSSPEQAIANLVDEINVIGLPKGIETSLSAPLGNIPELLEDINTNNDSAACGKLEAFINDVNAKEGSQLESDEASVLRGLASDIQLTIDCI